MTLDPRAGKVEQAKAQAEQEEAKVEALAWIDAAIQRATLEGRIQRAHFLTATRRLLQEEAA